MSRNEAVSIQFYVFLFEIPGVLKIIILNINLWTGAWDVPKQEGKSSNFYLIDRIPDDNLKRAKEGS